jgi:guanylate kinase
LTQAIPQRGVLIVISSPSGGGKTTVIREVRKQRPELGYSTSCTTRDPRPGEVNGVNYIFLSESEFLERINRGDFLEWEWVHGYRYGTLKETVAQALKRGQSLLFDLDVHGARSLKETYPDDSLLIFLDPPDIETLRQRLMSRAEDSPEEIEKRLKRLVMEMEAGRDFEVIVVNDMLEHTVNEVIAAIDRKLQDYRVA